MQKKITRKWPFEMGRDDALKLLRDQGFKKQRGMTNSSLELVSPESDFKEVVAALENGGWSKHSATGTHTVLRKQFPSKVKIGLQDDVSATILNMGPGRVKVTVAMDRDYPAITASTLRTQVIRLASRDEHLRPHLLRLLAE